MMDKHEHQQQIITPEVFNDVPDVVIDERDSLISGLLDRITKHKADYVENRKRYDELNQRYDAMRGMLSESETKRIKMAEALMLVGRSASMPVRDAILLDMSRCTIDYANRRDEENASLRAELERLKGVIAALEARNKELERRDAANDAGSTPMSNGTITQKQIKNKKRKKKKKEAEGQEAAKMGPPFGHDGVAREFKPDRVLDCTCSACPGCNGPILELPSDYYKSMIEIEEGCNVALEYWCHVHFYLCAECGVIECKPASMLHGTTIGKNFLNKIVRLTKSNKTGADMYNTLYVTYKKKLSRAAVRDALRVAGDLMIPGYLDIYWNIAGGTTINPDESVAQIGDDRSCQMWVAVGDKKWAMFHADYTRAKSVLEKVFPFPYLMSTNDAYAAYLSFFEIIQLCWAHVKTKMENAVIKDGRAEAQHLYSVVMDIFHHAKTLPPDTPQDEINALIASLKLIGQQFLDMGIKAGTYLRNCADHLFTAVVHPEMSFTNNLAERMLRSYVIRRKITYRFASE